VEICIKVMQSDARDFEGTSAINGGVCMAKRRVTSMLDEEDICALTAIAQKQRVSLAWVIRDAVRSYLTSGEAAIHKAETSSEKQDQ